MSSKRYDSKVWKLFTVTAVTAVFIASLSKAVSVEAQAMTGSTIDERLAKIRERLQQRQEQIKQESELVTSAKGNQEAGEDKTLQAQWNNWYNWLDGPWSNGPWSKWSDVPWSNEPWGDWGNW